MEIGQFDLLNSEAQTLVVPVNVVGAMGRGLAKAFSIRSPELFDTYRRHYRGRGYPDAVDNKSVLIHTLMTCPYPTSTSKQQVLLFPTKKHWLRSTQLDWVDHNLGLLARDYKKHNIQSLAVPALGCGNGELRWRDVLPLMQQHLGPLPIPVWVCEPDTWRKAR